MPSSRRLAPLLAVLLSLTVTSNASGDTRAGLRDRVRLQLHLRHARNHRCQRTERREPQWRVNCSNFSLASGPVTSVNVSGSVALINIRSSVGEVGYRVTDRGFTVVVPDLVELVALPGSGCPAPAPAYTDLHDVSSGFTVVDAPAVPTSKEQCKNAGWRTFGRMFKNQGQCVAFVERAPKP